MKHLKTGDLVDLTGYSRASIARMARRFEIPGTCAPDGLHFAFEDSAKLREWIEKKRKRREKFMGDRPTGARPQPHLIALNAGQTFHEWLSYLAQSGETDLALDLVGRMETAIEKVREECAKASWVNGERPDPETT